MGCPYKLYVTLIKNMHNVLFIRHGVWQMFSPKNCCWLGRLLTIIGFCFTILDCPSVLLFFSWSDCLLVFSGWSGFSLFLSLDLFVVLTWASACINWPHVRTAFIVLSLTVVPSGGLNTPVLITFMRRWLVLLIFVRQSAMFSSDRQYLSSWAILSTSMLCLMARTSVWRR